MSKRIIPLRVGEDEGYQLPTHTAATHDIEMLDSSTELRHVDRELLDALRRGPAKIADLVEALGVTATAVRQRIERLLELQYVQRSKQSCGRGRPTYQYSLTPIGVRQCGADPGQLVEVMWDVIVSLPDEESRDWLISQIAHRLGAQYREQIKDGTLESKMASMKELLGEKRILAEVSSSGNLPVLDLHECPYPDLADEDSRREMCQLEEVMLSEALGHPVHLSQCQLDGHDCCQFSPSRTCET